MNPFLTESTLPYGLPDFAALRLEHVAPAVTEGIARQNAEIAAILAETQPTWENTVEALERSGAVLDRATAWFFNLQGTDVDEGFEEVAEEIVPALSAHADAIYQNPGLYARLQAVEVPADEESRRLHEHLLRAFRRRGADLGEADKARLSEINQRLSVLSEQFGRTLLTHTRELAVRFDTVAELEGLPQSQINAARQLGIDTGTGGYVIAIELPSVQSRQESLRSAKARRRLYEASQLRGRGANEENLLEQVRLRAEKARLLGYDTHADYVIEEETAGTPEAAANLLRDLAPAASANAAAERKLAGELAGGEVDGADWPYWQARRAEEELDVDTAELAAYFPLDRVLVDGVFHAAHLLYGITVERREDLKAYREDVHVWEVFDSPDNGGQGLGLLLTDYSARPTKRGGAWMSTFRQQSRLTGSRPVVVNVMSITMPTDGSQPLLSVDEVTTLFHEFGHALHGLLSDVRYPRFSGTNVPRDWVEFPSQINENWAFEPEVVRHYARHVETGEVIPEELLDAVRDLRQFGQGFATAEYLAAAIIDLAWHRLSPAQAAAVSDVDAFEAEALREAGLVVEELAPRYRSAYFNHIFGGGYSAGYYSYLWAEALDADGFDWFSGQDDKRAAGQRFRELILATGASRDYGDAFATLRGRDKDVRPLLERRGLVGADVR
ncbi:M3 family metallopeptidase [Corynebacterium guangdongense]|uniref:Peptidyl-dipeptidase Dcp n=1 Tax=Corynebacterium guangdongense TaxID=1783348 RepID=A0ABU1ZYH9_9CORY|nr:peptidyl-dipeptidase Dcp [Corynebacterium guangdongense]